MNDPATDCGAQGLEDIALAPESRIGLLLLPDQEPPGKSERPYATHQ